MGFDKNIQLNAKYPVVGSITADDDGHEERSHHGCLQTKRETEIAEKKISSSSVPPVYSLPEGDRGNDDDGLDGDDDDDDDEDDEGSA